MSWAGCSLACLGGCVLEVDVVGRGIMGAGGGCAVGVDLQPISARDFSSSVVFSIVRMSNFALR